MRLNILSLAVTALLVWAGPARGARPGRRPAPRPAPKKDDFVTMQRAQILFTAELKKARPGPVARSMPPIYSHKLTFSVKQVLRGNVKAGDEVIAHHSARQLKRPTFPVGQLCVVAARSSRGSIRVQLVSKASADLLKKARAAASLPLGWSLKGEKRGRGPSPPGPPPGSRSAASPAGPH